MKIIVYGSHEVWGLGRMCSRAMAELEHEVYYFNREYPFPLLYQLLETHKFTSSILRRYKRKMLVKMAENVSPDLILIIKGYELDAETIAKLESQTRLGIVNWNPDNPFQIRARDYRAETYLNALSEYSLVCIWGRYLMNQLDKKGASTVCHLPFAYDPSIHYPMESDPRYSCDIIFIGHWSRKREKVLSELSDFNTQIYGPGWNECRDDTVRSCVEDGPITGESYSKAMSSAKIVLNVVADHNIPAYNMRAFEIPATCSVMATTHTTEQEDFFSNRREVILYQDRNDLVTSVDYYLANPSERRRLAEEGYTAVAPHTYKARMETMLGWLPS